MPHYSAYFWTAFLAGLASPTMVYAKPPPYAVYVPTLGPAENFAIAGSYVAQAFAQFDDDAAAASVTDATESDPS